MNNRYIRNRIYLTEEEQNKIKDVKIMFGGAGIGSVIAECALRYGFENIFIVDGDKVEESNLNRQNYTNADIGKFKAERLTKRLKSINPKAHVTFLNEYINHDNVKSILEDVDIAINALDYTSDIPFVFDKICSEKKIPVLHPYNFGWAGFLTVVKPDGYQLNEISSDYEGFEIKVAEFVARYCSFWNLGNEWLEKIISKYKEEKDILPPPQLSIASWLVAGLCVNAIYDLVRGKEILFFPKFYLSSLAGVGGSL